MKNKTTQFRGFNIARKNGTPQKGSNAGNDVCHSGGYPGWRNEQRAGLFQE